MNRRVTCTKIGSIQAVQQLEKLAEKLTNSPLSTLRGPLHEAMLSYVDGSSGYGIPGLLFIGNNLAVFKKLVSKENRYDFFATYLDNPFIIDLVKSPAFVLIPTEDRERLLDDIMSRYLPVNDEWVAAACDAGIRPQQIAKLLLSQVDRRSPSAVELTKHIFAHGWNPGWRAVSTWSILAEAGALPGFFESCARLIPELFFRDTTHLNSDNHVTKEELGRFKLNALQNLQSLWEVSIEDIKALSHDQRLWLIGRGLSHGLTLLVVAVLDGDITLEIFGNKLKGLKDDDHSLFAKYRGVFLDIRSAQAKKDDRSALADRVHEAVCNRLSPRYIIGVAEADSAGPFLRAGGHRYFPDVHSPKIEAGDTVFFVSHGSKRGRRIKKRGNAQTFATFGQL